MRVPIASRRGYQLIETLELTGPVQLLVTLELASKWYGFHVIQRVADLPVRVVEYSFAELESVAAKLHTSAYRNHAPNPAVLAAWAKANGAELDPVAAELALLRFAQAGHQIDAATITGVDPGEPELQASGVVLDSVGRRFLGNNLDRLGSLGDEPNLPFRSGRHLAAVLALALGSEPGPARPSTEVYSERLVADLQAQTELRRMARADFQLEVPHAVADTSPSVALAFQAGWDRPTEQPRQEPVRTRPPRHSCGFRPGSKQCRRRCSGR